jgi:hypothetical protein
MTARSCAALFFSALALALLLLVLAPEDASAVTYKTWYYTTLGCAGDDGVNGTNDDSCVPGWEYTPNVTADRESWFVIDSSLDMSPPPAQPRHSNFAVNVWTIVPDSWRIARGNVIDNGALMGRLTSTFVLSVLGGRCNIGVPADIPMFDATTDTGDQISWVANGENLLVDYDGNTMPDYIDHYPAYLHYKYVDLGPWSLMPSLKPAARYAGHRYLVPGAPATKLEYLLFDPHTWSEVGYWGILLLDNPVVNESPQWPSAITEFCEPLWLDMAFYGKTQGQGVLWNSPGVGMQFDVPSGQPGQIGDRRCRTDPGNPLCGIVRSINPAADTGLWNTGVGSQDTHLGDAYTESYRDGYDGIPNSEDTCPWHSDTLPPTDADNDGLFASCDPNDNQMNLDQDGDGFQNRQDNCPVAANPDQADADGDMIGDLCDRPEVGAECDNAIDDDKDDNMINDGCPAVGAPEAGTQCDKNNATDDDFDGKVNDGCPRIGYYLTPDGEAINDFVRDAVCLGTDSDGDGWCDADETLLGSNPWAIASVPENVVLDLRSPGTCANKAWYAGVNDPTGAGPEVDDDGDTLTNAADPGCPATIPGDTDKDGVPDAFDNCRYVYNPEQVNTDLAIPGPLGSDSAGDACDPDNDNDGFIDRIELLYGGVPKDKNHYGSSGFGYDISGDTTITIADVYYFRGTLGKPATEAGWNPSMPTEVQEEPSPAGMAAPVALGP